jgi:hypothetical protein
MSVVHLRGFEEAPLFGLLFLSTSLFLGNYISSSLFRSMKVKLQLGL